MRNLSKAIQQQKKRKEEQLKKTNTYLAKSVEGSLKFQTKGDKTYYYHQKKNPQTAKWEKIYIKRNQFSLIEELAQKGYFLKIKNKLEAQIAAMERFLGEYKEEEIEDLYSNMAEERKKFVTPISIGVREKMEAWKRESYEKCPLYADNCIYETNQGDMVRSKSEVIIANVLFQYKDSIAYKYERPLELQTRDGRTIEVHPDFTIINKYNGKIFYYEHAGCMEEIKYTIDFVKKINLYADNNIIQGRDLFITYETYNSPLNVCAVKEIVRYIVEQY